MHMTKQKAQSGETKSRPRERDQEEPGVRKAARLQSGHRGDQAARPVPELQGGGPRGEGVPENEEARGEGEDRALRDLCERARGPGGGG